MIDKSYRLQLHRAYKILLRKIIREEPFYPIQLRGGRNKPTTTTELHTITESFLRFEKKEGRPGWLIEWEPWQSRKLGNQRWPVSVSVQTEADLLFILDKSEELALFRLQLQQLLQWNHHIAGWLAAQPMAVLEWRSRWKNICAVLDYLLQHDVANYYIRSIPVPVHTKFIEQNESVFLSLLKHFQPGRFADNPISLQQALNLRQKPPLYPIRWLDPSLANLNTAGIEILALTPDTLRNVSWTIDEIWLVENETNLLLLPPRKNALAVFSKGYALHALKEIPILNRARLFYWGDLDEDGFIMLDQFRKYYPHARSIFMDKETIFFHRHEMDRVPFRLNRSNLELLPYEAEAYQFLLTHQGRIEQEKLQQDYMQTYLSSKSLYEDS